MLKQFLVPVAAFAVTVTGASAFTGGAWLSNLSDLSADELGITAQQKESLEEAFTLRQEARERSQQIIEDAGIDQDAWRDIHEAVRGERQEHRDAVRAAVEDNDYEAFRAAVTDSPLADIIDTRAEFEKFVDAHGLMEEGEREEAREILDELGVGGFGGRGALRAGEGFGRSQGGQHDGYGTSQGRGHGEGRGMWR